MPKININEYDLTKAGTGEYENFAVVVPGFVGKDCDLSVFDENGIYEVSNQKDFVANVGKRAAEVVTTSTLSSATAPQITLTIKYKPELAITEDFYIKRDADGNIIEIQYRTKEAYTAALNSLVSKKFDFESGLAFDRTVGSIEITDGDSSIKWLTIDGKLTNMSYEDFLDNVEAGKVFKDVDDKVMLGDTEITFEEYEGKIEAPNYNTYYASANMSGKIGHLKNETSFYHLVNVPEDDALTTIAFAQYPTVEGTELNIQPMIEATYNAYYVILGGDEGIDGVAIEDRITHYGNQMAYELLGLGYTVLFKKLDTLTDADFVDICGISDDKKNNDGTYDLSKFTNLEKDKDNNVIIDDFGAAVLTADKSAAAKQLENLEWWECLRDKSTYDFRYLVTGLLSRNDGANTCILSVADHSSEILLDDASISDGRGDCIALIDLDSSAYVGKTQASAIPALAKEAAKWSSAYAAVFAPYVNYILPEDDEYNNNSVFPASFHYLACAANSANNNFAEWYANAGYTRGVSKYTIQSTGCKLGEIAVQSLEPRFTLKVGSEKKQEQNENGEWVDVVPAENVDINTTVAINLIIKIKGSYYLWGNRTGKKLGTRGASDGDLVAQHFLNIRQLCTTIKKQVYVTCRRLTFDPNSNVLWLNFRSLLTPMLEDMKADQGIRDYKIIQDTTDRKALLKARIRIVPIEAVEDFDIGLYLEDSLENAVVTEG